jgi:hypothetical protein
MPAKIQEYQLLMYGVDKLSAPAEQASQATAKLAQQTKKLAEAQTFSQRVRAELLDKRQSGEMAVDRIFSGDGSKALDVLLRLGPEIAIASFAFDRLGAAAEGAAEHIKKVRDGSEGVVEALMGIARSIPIVGAAVAAGEGLGKLILTIGGYRPPEETIREAAEADKRTAEQQQRIEDARNRDRLIKLDGYAKQRETIEQKYKPKLDANNERRLHAPLESYMRGDHDQEIWEVRNIPGYASQHSEDEMATLRREAYTRRDHSAATKVYDEEEKRLKREKAKEMAEIDREEYQLRLQVIQEGEAKIREASERRETERLRRHHDVYDAERIDAERQYSEEIKRIDQENEKRKHDNPKLAGEFDRAAGLARDAAAAERNRKLQDGYYDQMRVNEQDGYELQKARLDAEHEARIRNLQIAENETGIQRENLRYAREAAEAAANSDFNKASFGLEAGTDELKRQEQLRQHRIDAAKAAQSAGNQQIDRQVEDHRLQVAEQLAQQQIDYYRRAGEAGDAAAERQARVLEIAQQYRQTEHASLAILKDQNATWGQRLQALLNVGKTEMQLQGAVARANQPGYAQAPGFGADYGVGAQYAAAPPVRIEAPDDLKPPTADEIGKAVADYMADALRRTFGVYSGTQN